MLLIEVVTKYTVQIITGLAVRFLTKHAMEELVFGLLGKLVVSTKFTDFDDKLLAKVKEEYYRNNRG